MKEETSVLGLATIRRNRGVSLEQIAESTKIGVRTLEAIERGDFRKLPGGIYNTSYIRQYARAIDYDESTLLEFYHRQMSSDPGRSTEQPGKGSFGGFRPASTIVGS
ncbi:MAG TPA: helix-turn-helix transcriptional regulator [Candidatus Sulfopaludibacter sp.]|jgi:cytoskeletal protein RodZ|nr:helix-turn-helix transcriptional regulator [Candidatus Sulfopaludibacter sp.]